MNTNDHIEAVRGMVNHSLDLLEVKVPAHVIDIVIARTMKECSLMSALGTSIDNATVSKLGDESFQAGLRVLYPNKED